MKSLTKKIFAVLLFLAIFLITGCKQGIVYNEITLTGAFRNASNTVKIFTEKAQSEEKLAALKKDMDSILINLDMLFDIQGTYKDSELMQIKNQAGIAPVEVSSEVIYVIQEALKMSERSIVDGVALFDPTIAPVWNEWDFPNNVYDECFVDLGMELSLEEIDEIKAAIQATIEAGLVDYRNIEINLEESTVFLKKAGMEIDLGAIVKGYAADKIKTYLIEQGYTSAVIDIGGNIQILGNLADQPFKVGIRTPYKKWCNIDYNENYEPLDETYGTIMVI
ncbi:MAG: hypothetical protein GX661_05165, partial [Acholeplasmataceae bacterium]|nr:hypothetical protein [Acholeplasmataceae bacterium]